MDDAREALRELPPDTPLLGPIGQIAAELTLSNKQVNRGSSSSLARSCVPIPRLIETSYGASMLSRAGPEHQAEAEAAFRQAVRLAAKEPDTWLALVDFLAGSNQRAKAMEVIGQAERVELPADQRSLVLAQCWVIVGDREKANAHFQAALQVQPNNILALRSFANALVRAGQSREAEPLLRRILEPALNAPAEEIRLARRSLAAAWVEENNPRKVQEALAMIESNLNSANPSDQDKQVKSLLLARRPGRRTDSIRLMEEKLRGTVPTPQEQLVLARLYDEDNQWPAARRMLLQLVATQRDDPLFLSLAAGALLQHNEPDTAEGLIGRLERREPYSLRTLELKSRWLQAMGRPREGIPPLEAYARANPSDRIMVARLIESLSPPEGSSPAEALYRDLVAQSGRPDRVLLLAEYYARHGQTDKALDLCERAPPSVPSDMVGRTCMMTLNFAKSKPSDAQMHRVSHWLDRAVERHSKVVELRIQQAMLRGMQGRHDETITIYRSILEGIDPGNSVCLNNLAFLLAVNYGKGDEALKLIDQAIASSGRFPSLLDTRAVALLTSGRGSEAIQDLETAIAQGAGPSTMRSLYFHLARASLMEKNLTAAENAFVKAAQAGLKAENVNPRERSEYERLVGELKIKS